MLWWILSAAGASLPVDRAHAAVPVDAGWRDQDGNGVEDVLDAFLSGRRSWSGLRTTAAGRGQQILNLQLAECKARNPVLPAAGDWAAGRVRIISLGSVEPALSRQRAVSTAGDGVCRIIHASESFGGFCVLAVDSLGLRGFLKDGGLARVLLDREGVPALNLSRTLVGADQVAAGSWQLGQDWSGTVAVLDSGCDTAHGDLGDYSDDDMDGPPPAVGDSGDWYAADSIWPLFTGYKVMGWQDVTDDFPFAAGPWDYHHHGTSLASVVSGGGAVDWEYRGIAPQSRLTIVKFYDFDQIWHAWAGDFLAAAAWALEHRDAYRIRSVLVAVNWEVDAGIGAAMSAFLEVGILPVAAMGNFGSSAAGPGFPAVLPDVLTVGSVNDAGAVAAYSGRGLSGQDKPDLLAPGGGLLSSQGRITAADNEPNDTYSGRQGTSLAAAHAAGAVYLLGEAMIQNGIPLPDAAAGARLIKGLLKATAAPVTQAESPEGSDQEPLPYDVQPDPTRGWGMLRVDAACEALLDPLFPAQSQTDTLDEGFTRPVAARRLVLNEGLQYLVEAVPAPGLDVSLMVVPASRLADPAALQPILRVDANGPGTSEFTYLSPDSPDWYFLVVKCLSGQGTVTMRVIENDGTAWQAARAQLPGNLSGAPNWGRFAGLTGPSLVIPSLVRVDDAARSLSLLDRRGVSRPGWPVYLFPQVSSVGGLNQPLVWDLDGAEGDEIVITAQYGTVYFFGADGTFTKRDLVFNRSLTTPVGVVAGDGSRRVVVLDRNGQFRSWAWGPQLLSDRALGYTEPLAPAVGQVASAAGEEVAVAFAAGQVTVLDAQGETLPGWPVDLGSELSLPPVLVDLDGDDWHEIYVPVLSAAGDLHLRVFTGDGLPGPSDGAVLPAPGGGQWRTVSWPACAGLTADGNLRLIVAGVGDNGLSGQEARLQLGRAGLGTDAEPFVNLLADFRVDASTSQGYLDLLEAIIPAPLSWRNSAGEECLPVFTACLRWQEIIYGVTSIPGSLVAQFSPLTGGPPLTTRTPLGPGGRAGGPIAKAGLMVIALDQEYDGLVEVINNQLGIRPLKAEPEVFSPWSRARADGRNSGALPLGPGATPVMMDPPLNFRLSAVPNPGSDRFEFRLTGSAAQRLTNLEIFDLRGRLVRQLTIAPGRATGIWDGRNGQGRPVGTGVYLVRLEQGDRYAVSRVMVTR